MPSAMQQSSSPVILEIFFFFVQEVSYRFSSIQPYSLTRGNGIKDRFSVAAKRSHVVPVERWEIS